MRMYPSPVIASELARTVLVKNYFYRVRMEAARALAMVCPVPYLCILITKLCQQYNSSECDYIGYFLIMKLFQVFYCQPSSGNETEPPEIQCLPLPNDFSNFADYFVKKVKQRALAECDMC